MPNCDYYATLEDHRIILDFLFDEKLVYIFELYSDYEKPLRQFKNSTEIISEFNRQYSTGQSWHTVYLKLLIKELGIDFQPTRIELNPNHCDGFKYRFSAKGFCFVQLYLSIPREQELQSSHTNHFTAKGYEKWEEISINPTHITQLNFDRITKFSSKLNRQIKKLGIAKIGSRIISKSALELWNNGYKLIPFTKENAKIEMIKIQR